MSNVLMPERLVEFTDNRSEVDRVIASTGLDYGEFHIEEFWSAVNSLKNRPNYKYIRMDFGVPGLKPATHGLDVHQKILKKGEIAQQYPPYAGVADLRRSMSEFISNRLNTSIDSKDIFVTCGATQALFVAQSIAAKLNPKASAVAFLTPNYPPMCAQARFLGLNVVSIEVDGKRGKVLIEEIRKVFATNVITAFCWASPSNPGWMILNHEELAGIAGLCKEFNVIPIEDLTYLGMIDTCKNDIPTKLPSIAKYIDDYILILSTSKMLSYAGERIGFLIASSHLLSVESEKLKASFGVTSVRRACGSLIFNLTGGAPHSGQYAVANVIDSINRGDYDLDGFLSIYIKRAKKLSKILVDNGFYLIYSSGIEEDLKGFYVSFGYPSLSEFTLVKELLYNGITVLPLSIFGSKRKDGVRACVGRIDDEQLLELESRINNFSGEHHEIN